MTGPHCLVTGATGYIGGRLVPELLDAGHRVRCLARSPERLRDHPWAGRAEVVRGDVTDPDSVAAALRGIDVAYYLVHALGTGSGSASFEMLRYLTERLPVMVTPSWVGSRIQPIAVRDVLRYLVGSASMPPGVSRSFDIGGPDVVTYEEMMHRYAAVARLPKRLILRVPMPAPRLSSHWIGLVTPVPRGLARPLAESLRHEVVCDEHDIAVYVPDPPGSPIGLDPPGSAGRGRPGRRRPWGA